MSDKVFAVTLVEQPTPLVCCAKDCFDDAYVEVQIVGHSYFWLCVHHTPELASLLLAVSQNQSFPVGYAKVPDRVQLQFEQEAENDEALRQELE